MVSKSIPERLCNLKPFDAYRTNSDKSTSTLRSLCTHSEKDSFDTVSFGTHTVYIYSIFNSRTKTKTKPLTEENQARKSDLIGKHISHSCSRKELVEFCLRFVSFLVVIESLTRLKSLVSNHSHHHVRCRDT